VQLSSLEAFLTRANSGRTTIFLASGNEILGASGRKHWSAPKGRAADELRDGDEMDGGDDDVEAAFSK
jgi:hypothetical protein